MEMIKIGLPIREAIYSDKNKVYGFGYRKARVKDIWFVLEEDWQTRQIESRLAEKTGMRVDNHTTYAFQYKSKMIALQFSDGHVFVGEDVAIGDW